MSEPFRLSPEQEEEARALGHKDRPCPTCKGNGQWNKPNAGAASGLGFDVVPCNHCGQLGRLWGTDVEWDHYRRRKVPWRVRGDRKMAEVLEAGGKE